MKDRKHTQPREPMKAILYLMLSLESFFLYSGIMNWSDSEENPYYVFLNTQAPDILKVYSKKYQTLLLKARSEYIDNIFVITHCTYTGHEEITKQQAAACLLEIMRYQFQCTRHKDIWMILPTYKDFHDFFWDTTNITRIQLYNDHFKELVFFLETSYGWRWDSPIIYPTILGMCYRDPKLQLWRVKKEDVPHLWKNPLYTHLKQDTEE